MPHQGSKPRRRRHHLIDRAHSGLERHGKPVSHFARPFAARRNIKRENEHMGARAFGAFDQIEADFVAVTRDAIELKPERIRRHFAQAFHGGAADASERERNTRALRGPGKGELCAGPDHARQSDRRDADRCGIAPAEQSHFGRRVRAIHTTPRDKLDRVERGAVRMHVVIETDAAIGYSKAKPGMRLRARSRRSSTVGKLRRIHRSRRVPPVTDIPIPNFDSLIGYVLRND